MSKSEELLRLERDLKEQPELKEKLDAETRRVAEAGEAGCDGEAMVKAAAALGYSITVEELERAAADLEKLDDDELEAAGGDSGKEPDHTGWCIKSWHCFAAIRHTDTESKSVACWSDYVCILAYEDDLVTKAKEKVLHCTALEELDSDRLRRNRT